MTLIISNINIINTFANVSMEAEGTCIEHDYFIINFESYKKYDSSQHTHYKGVNKACTVCEYSHIEYTIREFEDHSFTRSDTHTPGKHHTTFSCSDCFYSYTETYPCPGNPCLIFDSIKDELYE